MRVSAPFPFELEFGRRGATLDGSRGFQPTVKSGPAPRRGATPERIPGIRAAGDQSSLRDAKKIALCSWSRMRDHGCHQRSLRDLKRLRRSMASKLGRRMPNLRQASSHPMSRVLVPPAIAASLTRILRGHLPRRAEGKFARSSPLRSGSLARLRAALSASQEDKE